MRIHLYGFLFTVPGVIVLGVCLGFPWWATLALALGMFASAWEFEYVRR